MTFFMFEVIGHVKSKLKIFFDKSQFSVKLNNRKSRLDFFYRSDNNINPPFQTL